MTTVPQKALPRISLGVLGVAFGLATLVEGGRVLFGGPEARAAAGNVVEFVLRFNFGAGLFYVFAGGAMLLGRPAARMLATALAVTSAAVFAMLIGHIGAGGAFEKRTLVAMLLRTSFWVGIALFLSREEARRAEASLPRAAGD